MKQFVKYLFSLAVVLLSAFSPLQADAEESYIITLEKGGQLSKYIKKADVLNVKFLTVSGLMNNLDLELIASMSNLEELDLKDAVLSNEKYDPKKNRDYYDDRVLKLPSLLKLRKLINSKKSYHLKNLRSLPSLKYLTVFDGDIDQRQDDNNMPLSLDTLALLSTKDRRHEPSKYDVERYICDGTVWGLEKYSKNLTNPIKAKVLISEIDHMHYADHSDVIANIVKIPGYTILYHWSPELSEEQIESVDVLVPYSYIGADIKEVTIPSKVKTLPSYLGGMTQIEIPLSTIARFNIPEINSFIDEIKSKDDKELLEYYLNQKYPIYSKIEKINLGNIEDIDAYALDGFVIKHLTLPPTLKYFNVNAFKNNNILEAQFTSKAAPIVYEKYHDTTRNYLSNTGTKFIAPKGTIDKFRIGPWGSLNNGYWSACLFEDGNNGTLELTIEEPGTLSKYITDANALNIENLIIKGLLYDTDFEAINKCKNLRSLDLSNTFTCLSPETLSRNKKTASALMGLLGLAFEGAAADSKSKFDNGQGSYVEAEYYGALNDRFRTLMSKPSIENIKADPACVLPEDAFKGLRFLISIAYPSQMENLKNGSLHSDNVYQIVLPPNLKILNAHIGTPYLSAISIPSSVKEIKGYVFSGSKHLKELDLRNTGVETIAWSALNDCPNLQNFYGSPVLKAFDHNNYSGTPKLKIGWFYTKTMPKGLNYFKCIHIPEGYSASYTGLYNTLVLDDIPE